MTLGDQLQELRVAMLRDRSDQIAGDSDQLWTDARLLRYIKDAEHIFARRTMILKDATTPRFCQLRLREGVITYPMPKEVFGVISGRPDGRDFDLHRTGRTLVQARDTDTSITFDPSQYGQLQPGAPLGFYTDETEVYDSQNVTAFSIFPAPDAQSAGLLIRLRVVRVPGCGYTTNDLKRESELPERYHLDVLEWAAYRAKRNNDADIGTTPNADAHKQAFYESIELAKKDARRQMHVNTGLRFGCNGFSWSR